MQLVKPVLVFDIPVTNAEIEVLYERNDEMILVDVHDMLCGNLIEDNSYFNGNVTYDDVYRLTLSKIRSLMENVNFTTLSGINLKSDKFILYAQ